MARSGTLARTLGPAGTLYLTLSVATPASSVFVIVPGMLQVAGTAALLAMLVAGAIGAATAFIYAELSSAFPVAGGEYVAVAHTLGPLAGFVMLGVNVCNNLLFAPVAGLGVGTMLAAIWPGVPRIPVAVAIVAGSALVAMLRIRVNARITGVFLAIEVAALVAVAAIGLAMPVRGLGPLIVDPVADISPGAFGLAVTIAIFALNGYGAAVYFAEELADARRRIARIILAALMVTLALEAAPLAAGLAGAPDLARFLAADDPFGLLVATRATPLAPWMALAVALAMVNAVIACTLACARFFYGTARDGSWGRPVDRWLVAIHPRFGSPWVATLAIGAVGVACCFLPLTLLLLLSGTGLVAIYAGIALAVIAGRRNGSTAAAAYRLPLYPLAPALTLVALGCIVWISWQDVAEGRPALIATGVQIALAALYYRFVLRRRGGWEARIPT